VVVGIGRIAMVGFGLLAIVLAALFLVVSAMSLGGRAYFAQVVLITLLLVGSGGWLIRRGLAQRRAP
jgi:hypothetical protein